MLYRKFGGVAFIGARISLPNSGQGVRGSSGARGSIAGLRATIGSLEEAGLPEITGTGVRRSFYLHLIQWSLIFAATTVIVTTAFTFVGSHFAYEWIDKVWLLILFACAAASVVGLSLVVKLPPRTDWSRGTQLAFSAAVVVSLAIALRLAVERFPDPLARGEAEGPQVGWAYLLGAGMAVTAVVVAMTRHSTSRLLLLGSILVAATVALIPLLQTPTTFLNGYNLAFTFDELLAPAAGRLPWFDYVNQYQTLLGYPIAIIGAFAPAWVAASPESFAVATAVGFQTATLVVAAGAIARLAPRRVRWIVPIALIPSIYLLGSVGLVYYAIFPFRFFFPVLLLGGIVFLGFQKEQRGAVWWIYALLGTGAGLAVLNNLDFGVPTALAALVAVALPSPSWRAAARAVSMTAAGIVVVPLLYLAIGTIAGKQFHLEYALFFIQSFGVDGFNNVPIPVFDLHTSFVFLGVIGLLVGVIGSRRSTRRGHVLHTAIVFQSSLLLLSLVYYSGRSLIDTIVSAYTLPAAILLVLMFIAGFPLLRRLRSIPLRRWRLGGWVVGVLTITALSLPTASWLAFPPIGPEIARLQNPAQAEAETLDYLSPSPEEAVQALPAGTDLIGMLGVSGSTWSLRLGIPNANVFLHPDYLEFAGGARLECEYIATLPGDSLLTTRTLLESLEKEPVCTDLLDFDDPLDLVTVDASKSSNGDSGEWILVSRR